MLVVKRLPCILFQMQPLNADLDVFKLPLPVRSDGHEHCSFADNRLLELRNLVALRQVGIEIVFAVKHRLFVDLRLQPEPRAHRLLDTFLIDDRQHPGHRGIDQRHMRVWRAAKIRRSAGEELGMRQNLRMHFEADDHFPIAGCA